MKGGEGLGGEEFRGVGWGRNWVGRRFEGWGRGRNWGRERGAGRVIHMLSQHLARRSAHIMELRVPELEAGLPLEPALAHQQAVDDAGGVLRAARLLGRRHHPPRDHRAVRFRDRRRFQLARHHPLDLVLEAQCDFRDFGGGDRGWDPVVAREGEDCAGGLVGVGGLGGDGGRGPHGFAARRGWGGRWCGGGGWGGRRTRPIAPLWWWGERGGFLSFRGSWGMRGVGLLVLGIGRGRRGH